MNQVRIGLIGVGNMGSFYADQLSKGEIARAQLVAVCDEDNTRLERWSDVARYSNAEELLASGSVDAVIIATPHYSHTTIGIAALKEGLHVLVDKPVSVHKADAEKLLAAHTNRDQVFAAMFNQRTDQYFLKIKELIEGGELGELRRVNWIITNWFRTETYFTSSAWRATWAGEGGGVLLNQCPHQLDMLCWLVGSPTRVDAHCHFGKYHDIEVDDEVTAYLEFENGGTGIFITSTGEAPGTNRLEVIGEKGKVVFEDDRLVFHKNAQAMTEFSRTTTDPFGAPEVETIEFADLNHGRQHMGVVENFVEAVLNGKPLIAPAQDGLASVELANAMLMSAFENRPIDLPIDAEAYASHLKKKINNSTHVKKVREKSGPTDMSKSF